VILKAESSKISVVVLNTQEELVDLLWLGPDEGAVTLPKPSEAKLTFLHVGPVETHTGAAGALGPDELTSTMKEMVQLPALGGVNDVMESQLELGSKLPVLPLGFYVRGAEGRRRHEIRVEL
jgi:hypothetical protein